MILECELDGWVYEYPYDEPFIEDDYSEDSMP
jgi:hypothetical protein